MSDYQPQQEPMPLFDGLAAKAEGMQGAADAKSDLLNKARMLAATHAADHGTVTMDDVATMMEKCGLPELGPAAGSVFKGSEWEFTGQRVLSTRAKNHARELKVWRLK